MPTSMVIMVSYGSQRVTNSSATHNAQLMATKGAATNATQVAKPHRKTAILARRVARRSRLTAGTAIAIQEGNIARGLLLGGDATPPTRREAQLASRHVSFL